MRHRSDVGCAAKTSFIAEQTALHALHDGDADTAAYCRLQTKCTTYDVEKSLWYRRQVQANNHQGCQEVANRHDRYDDLGYDGNTFDTTEDSQPQQ